MKNRRRKISTAACILALTVFCLSGCADQAQDVGKTTVEETNLAETDKGQNTITLSDDGSTVSGEGLSLEQNAVLITKGGTYTVTGSLSNGQIRVDADDDEAVTLVLDGAELTNMTDAALDIEQADEVYIKLADGSENLIQSGTSLPASANENASGGALFSRDDLTISGNGSLVVNGFLNDGIHGNDDLTIEGGTIEVTAAHHAVKANELLTVSGGSLTTDSNTDGIHSEKDLAVTGGEIEVRAGDDGIHADAELSVSDGSITIDESYEGIEGNVISITGGDFSVTSSDDGFNAYGGQFNMGKIGSTDTADTAQETPSLTIDGGSIYVNAGGDGLDSNGDLIVNDGYIIVDGPENSMNGALDSGTENGGTCAVNGGTVLAIGASGMAERFGDNSAQATFRVDLDTQQAGTQITIKDADGNELMSHTAPKSFSSIVFSSPDIQIGADYTVTVGDESFTFTQESVSYTNSSGPGGGMSQPDGGMSQPDSGTTEPGGGTSRPSGGMPGTGGGMPGRQGGTGGRPGSL